LSVHKNIQKVFTTVLISMSLLLCCAGCKKKPAPWPSLSFVGNFNGNESCLLNGAQSDTLHIVATNATSVSITNLYGLSQLVTGSISNDSCVIQPQISGNYVLQGILLLSSDTINMSIIASSFGREDKCNAVLIKQ
jgi:hypothetical protein